MISIEGILNVHPLASVIATEYVPALILFRSSSELSNPSGPFHSKLYGSQPPSTERTIEPFESP